jgi:hypothetical protein
MGAPQAEPVKLGKDPIDIPLRLFGYVRTPGIKVLRVIVREANRLSAFDVG